jgi:hypothetical protein
MPFSPLEVFRVRAETRARLFYVGLYRDVQQAMRPLLEEAKALQLAERTVRDVINEELEKVGLPGL